MSRLSKLILKMTQYEDGCVERVNHFMKVYAFAKAIAEGEGIDDETQAWMVQAEPETYAALIEAMGDHTPMEEIVPLPVVERLAE